MLKTSILPFIILLSFAFTACQKEPLVGDRDFKTLGTSARDLLSASSYTSLLVEISYMPGYEPGTDALSNLENFLQTYLNKPAGIRVTQKQISPSGKTFIGLNEIVSIEKSNRSLYTAGNTITVHVLIADAKYAADTSVLGLSYWNTSISLFGKNILENSGRVGQVNRSKLFSTLLEHEFGHLLGLVGQGSNMQENHRDADNGAHCNNPDCLMYYGIETAENLGSSTNNTIPTLDDHCKADLKANGGK